MISAMIKIKKAFAKEDKKFLPVPDILNKKLNGEVKISNKVLNIFI